MADVPPAGSFEYLRTQAIARLYLDNIPNIQSSWVTQGLKIGQLALFFGANDMGSLMIEENVVAVGGHGALSDAGADQGRHPRGRATCPGSGMSSTSTSTPSRRWRIDAPHAADFGTARVPYSRAGTCWQSVSR